MDKHNDHPQMIRLEKLTPFQGHPFSVREDEQMGLLTESIRSIGVLIPAIARPLGNDTFELIAGHRRKRACELVGTTAMPVWAMQCKGLLYPALKAERGLTGRTNKKNDHARSLSHGRFSRIPKSDPLNGRGFVLGHSCCIAAG